VARCRGRGRGGWGGLRGGGSGYPGPGDQRYRVAASDGFRRGVGEHNGTHIKNAVALRNDGQGVGDRHPHRRVRNLLQLAALGKFEPLARLEHRVQPVEILRRYDREVDVDRLARDRAPAQVELEFNISGSLSRADGAHHVGKRQLSRVGRLARRRSTRRASTGMLSLTAAAQARQQRGQRRDRPEIVPQGMHRPHERSLRGSKNTDDCMPSRGNADSGLLQALAAQQRRIIYGARLLDQIADMSLPIACLREPGKSPWKGRIVPAMSHPRRVVQHAQGTQ
jgi:hypothetical protein